MRKMKDHVALADSAYGIAADGSSGAYDHAFTLEEIMVILKVSSDDEFAVIGRLAEMDSRYIAFSYVVLDRTLADMLDKTGVVLLKRERASFSSAEEIPCIVVSDTEEGEAPYLSLRTRKCVLKRISP